ncbi:MAG: hypothetical protein ACI93P_000347 [bacterium]
MVLNFRITFVFIYLLRLNPNLQQKMNARILLLVLVFLVFPKQDVYSQLGFSHEVGVIVGPSALYSDFGERSSTENNIGNTGIGIGLIHYINFAYRADCNCYTRDKYWNDHFKIRTEVALHKVSLKHRGRWVADDQQGQAADFLRSMSGKATNFEIGSQLEYFPFSIRDFSARKGSLAPFISTGIHFVGYSPEVSYINDGDYYGGKYDPATAIRQEGGNTWALVTSIGIRYKLSTSSDLMLDSRLQYYFSNWIDGLSPDVPENLANEWIYWLNFGYIYYIN